LAQEDAPEHLAPSAAAESKHPEIQGSQQQMQQEAALLLDQWLLEESAGANPNPEMRNHGQIAEMTLPVGWVEAPPYRFRGGVGMRSFRKVYPPEAPQVVLGFYYRGLPTTEESARGFHAILSEPPHALRHPELNALAEVLRDKAHREDFAARTVRTEDVNGKRVLVVQGTYTIIQEDCLEIFVDARRDGAVIQEIFFQAPTAEFRQYLPAAKRAFQSIIWT
jgi:hypothetical protein